MAPSDQDAFIPRPDDDDVEGHGRPTLQDDDHVEGHGRPTLQDDDDVEGHGRPI